MEEMIKLFGKKECNCVYYPGKEIRLPFEGENYSNVLVYRPISSDIPNNLKPETHQCVKNACYVGRYYGASIVEGVIIMAHEGYKSDATCHCWNETDSVHFDVTPFELAPQDIIYIPYRKFEYRQYREKFRADTKTYTFLSGLSVLDFEKEARKLLPKL